MCVSGGMCVRVGGMCVCDVWHSLSLQCATHLNIGWKITVTNLAVSSL